MILAIAAACDLLVSCSYFSGLRHEPRADFTVVSTLAGLDRQMGEPFGIGVKNDETFVSDGANGKIWKLSPDGSITVFAENLHTPSAIAFDNQGDLLVADTGSHTIKQIDNAGNISVVAGAENIVGDVDGDASSARFNAPIGLAVRGDGAVVVADTYNDKIKLVQNGRVSTLAGSRRGFADGAGINAEFDTPCGVAIWRDGRIIIADMENRRLRVVEQDGTTWTLAGNGEQAIEDGLLAQASFVAPTAIAVTPAGEIFVADNDSVRAIGRRSFSYVETLSGHSRGFVDGTRQISAFNRVSGLAFDKNGNLLVTDSDNAAIRVFQTANPENHSRVVHARQTDPAEFRARQAGRWPFDPPERPRDVAGTIGELRGEVTDTDTNVRFHNGFDVAGAYGEAAYFIRDEKVLKPAAAENFGTSRELLRMPTLGYIHLRLGRDSSDRPFGEARFRFDKDADGRIVSVRIPRGTKFTAGDMIGTLNSMNHVHLIAGPSGDEMNALAALDFPGIADTTPPTIEQVSFFDENWRSIETGTAVGRIMLKGKVRIVARAFDRMDGNPERRRLGVYKVGYQVSGFYDHSNTQPDWTLHFDRMPANEAAKFVYSEGSRSGATGETVFNYIATNRVSGEAFSEDFLDTDSLAAGVYRLRVFAADFFGNIASKDIIFEVIK